MLKLDDIYKKNEDNWVSRVIVDEVVIMPLCRSEDDMQYIYSISNEAGTRIFSLLDGHHSVRDIQEVMKREFKGNAEVIERGVLEFLKDLLNIKLIEKATNSQYRASSDKRYSMSDTRAKGKKKPYKSPEIAKIKMQPEQAVLACCTSESGAKYIATCSVLWANACGTLACATNTCKGPTARTGSSTATSGASS